MIHIHVISSFGKRSGCHSNGESMRYMCAIYSPVKGRNYLHFCLAASRTKVSCPFFLHQTFRCYFRFLNSSHFDHEKITSPRKARISEGLREWDRGRGVTMNSILLLPLSGRSPASRFSGKWAIFPGWVSFIGYNPFHTAPTLILQHTHR